MEYTVIDEFVVNEAKVKGAKVLVLDREWEFSSKMDEFFTIGDKKYSYILPHHRKWIIVYSDEEFIGKTIIL